MHNLKLAAETSPDFFIACMQEYLKLINKDTKIRLKEFDPSELDYFILRPEQKDKMSTTMLQQAEMIVTYSTFNISVYHEDTLMFVGGVIPIWEGVAEGWLLVSQDFEEYFKKEPKVVLKGMKTLFQSLPFNRIQTPVLKGFKQGTRFLEAFGFEEEGIMKKYGPDARDYHRYALVRS